MRQRLCQYLNYPEDIHTQVFHLVDAQPVIAQIEEHASTTLRSPLSSVDANKTVFVLFCRSCGCMEGFAAIVGNKEHPDGAWYRWDTLLLVGFAGLELGKEAEVGGPPGVVGFDDLVGEAGMRMGRLKESSTAAITRLCMVWSLDTERFGSQSSRFMTQLASSRAHMLPQQPRPISRKGASPWVVSSFMVLFSV
jgi:hypothetical protein